VLKKHDIINEWPLCSLKKVNQVSRWVKYTVWS